MRAIEIRALRERMGMTQREFADEIGVRPEIVCRWENGHREPGKVVVTLLRRMMQDVVGGEGQAA